MTAADFKRCPLDVIKGTRAQRVQYFKNHLTAHPNQRGAYDKVVAAIQRATGPRIIMVTGPTGVGKTTLVKHLHKALAHHYAAEVKSNPACVPVLSLSAVPPNSKTFSWKDFYIRLLLGHGDVLIDKKLVVPRQDELFAGALASSQLDRAVSDALRRSVENSLKHRSTKVLIIDEAHHLLMVGDPSRLEYQFETIKSLTIESDVTIVLVGTYRLLDIRDQSGQLVRRSQIAHLPRYDIRKGDDVNAFASFVLSVAHHLPFDSVPDLSPHFEHVYTKTAGCVGIFKDWFAQAVEEAIMQDEPFTMDFANQYALDNKQLRTIIEEAMVGELKLQDEPIREINALLHNGLEMIGGPVQVPKLPATRRVGERRPFRDPTGGVRHVAP